MNILEKVKDLIIDIKDDEISEQRAKKLNYQIKEFKYQEKYLQELIEREEQDISEFLLMKTSRLESLNELKNITNEKMNKLEKLLNEINLKIEKSC